MQKLATVAAAFSAMAFSVPVAAQALLVVDGSGELTGATGVNVNGSLYDVNFLDGTCAALFSGCDDVTDFVFTDEASADLAAQALLDQVFLDGVFGQFDTNPELTRGCESLPRCFSYIPYGLGGASNPARGSANGSLFYGEPDYTFSANLPLSFDASVSFHTYAVFSRSGVPEPSTWAMMLLGFGAVGYGMRRRRRSENEARKIA